MPDASVRSTIDALRGGIRCAVIEGDVATTNDADRIAGHGVPAVQVITEQLSASCHLDARMVQQALGARVKSGAEALSLLPANPEHVEVAFIRCQDVA